MNLKNTVIAILTSIIAFSSYSQDVKSLSDSIEKYKTLNPQKAIDFGLEAIDISKYEEISYALFEINYSLGEILYFLKNYSKSLKYLTTSFEIYELLPVSEKKYTQINKPPWNLLALGNLYLKTNKDEKAKELFQEAIENFNLYEEEFITEKLDGLNTAESNLALISRRAQNYEQAEYYYLRILERRKSFGKKSHRIFSYAVIMDFYFNNNKEDIGLYYYNLSKKLFDSEKLKEGRQSELKLFYSYALSIFALHLKNKKEFKKSLEFYYKAKKLTPDFPYDLDQFPNIDLEISECLFELKMYDQAEKTLLENLNSKSLNKENRIKNFRVLAKVYSVLNKNNELLKIKDSIINTYNEIENINFYNLENQLILNEKENEINENKIKNYKFNMTISIGILFSILIIITLVFKFKYQKEKSSRLELEKKQISGELESKNIELVSKANFILQRNEYLKNIKAKLKKSEVTEKSFNKIEKDITELINSEKSYEEFDKIFTQVYPDFYSVLNTKHNLSQTYLRLAAYIKMNQSNNEIAKISGISLRTVETQRYRFLKKLKLDNNQDLNTYIQNL